MSLFSLYGLCNPVTYCLVGVSASQSSRKCSMSSVVFALHISQFVYPSVCLLSMLSFKVPVLALNKVVVALNIHFVFCFIEHE